MEKIKFYTHQNHELKTEALKILLALGYVWKGETHYLEQRLPDAIYGNEGGLILLEHQRSLAAFNKLYKDSRTVNIEDLRVMLVLHLNDVNNATHEALDGSFEYLQLNDKFYVFESEKWIESPETDVWHANNLRPIPVPDKYAELLKQTSKENSQITNNEIELNNFKIVDGVEAISAVRDGFDVEYETDEGGWDQFDFETGFKVGCLLGQPNQHNKVVRFRVVPKTLKIVGIDGNVYEFPTPIHHYPPEGTTCFIATLSDPGSRLPQQTTFSGNEITKMWVDHRRLHLTAEAALAHIEAEVRALGGNF